MRSLRGLWILSVFLSGIITLRASSLPGAIPYFRSALESHSVKPDTSISLQCPVQPATARISWLFNGEELRSDSPRGVSIRGTELRIPSFKWRPDDRSHVGTYQCKAKTQKGTIVSNEATLTKAVLGQFADALDEYVEATEGNVALIPCQPPDGEPKPVILFEVNSTTIGHNTGRHVILPSGNLQISRVIQADQGIYRCIAINPVTGLKRSATNNVHLRVATPVSNRSPRLIDSPAPHVRAMKGDNITLECVAEGSPVPVITWDKYGGHLPEGRHRTLLGNLMLTNLQPVDRGAYVCRGENGEGNAVTSVSNVHVMEAPVIRRPPTNQIVNVGQDVSLPCQPKGSANMDVTWLQNGREISNDEHYVKEDDGTLSIEEVQLSHAGMYQCVISSRLGKAQAAAHLDVWPVGEPLPEVPDDTNNNNNGMQDIAPDLIPESPSTPTDDSIFGSRDPDSGRDENGNRDRGDRNRDRNNNDRDRDRDRGSRDRNRDRDRNNDRDRGRDRDRDGDRNRDRDRDARDRDRANNERRRDRDRDRNNRRDRDRQRLPDSFDDHDSDFVDAAEEILPSAGRDRPPRLVPPSKPQILKISDTSVMVTWTVRENSGLPITFFKVQYRQLDGEGRLRGWRTVDEDIPSNVLQYEVRNLRSTATYKFRIVAVYSNNDNKNGPNSARFRLSTDSANQPRSPTTRPVIVNIEAVAANALKIVWQYMPTEEVAIEGFFLYHKPYNAEGDFRREALLGPGLRHHVLTSLQPGQHYSIKLRAFNAAGQSQFSNVVVKRTLSYPGAGDMDEHGGIRQHNSDDRVLRPEGDDDRTGLEQNRLSTATSSKLFYTILGVVLGILLLLLLIFMGLCAWKQRKQGAHARAAKGSAGKFNDPSKDIYDDTKRKPHLSNGAPFLLSTLSNGHGPPRVNGHPNGNLHVNVNPLDNIGQTQFMNESTSRGSMQSTRDSLSRELPPPPPPDGLSCENVAKHNAAGSDTDNYTPINNCKTPGSDKMDYSIYTRPASPALSSFKSHPSWKDRGGEPEKAPPLPARPYMTLERSSAAPRIKMVPHSQASLPRLGRRAASLRQTANVQPINSSNPMMMGDPSNMPYSDGGYSGRRRGSAPKPGYFYGNLNEPPYSHSDHYSIDEEEPPPEYNADYNPEPLYTGLRGPSMNHYNYDPPPPATFPPIQPELKASDYGLQEPLPMYNPEPVHPGLRSYNYNLPDLPPPQPSEWRPYSPSQGRAHDYSPSDTEQG